MRADVAFLQSPRDRLTGDTLPGVCSGMQQTSGFASVTPASPAAQRKLSTMSLPPTTRAKRNRRERAELDLLLADKTTGSRRGHPPGGDARSNRGFVRRRWPSTSGTVGKRTFAVFAEKQTTEMATDLFDVEPTAQLARSSAESDAISAVVAWEIAQVKLQQAQGLLAQECGYRLPCADGM